MKIKNAFRWAKEFNPGFDRLYANNLAAKFSLDTAKRVKDLSTGYLSIFKLILTLSSNLPVMIFDEPVLGLDANYRELFYRELIQNYSRQEKTIILSTHLIDEVAEIVEEVVIIEYGRILLAQSVDEIVRQGYTVSGDSVSVDEFARNRNVIREESLGRYKAATIFQNRTAEDDTEITKLNLDVAPARLQELFVALTNRSKEVVTGAGN
jgi:ABC-2 type transport system ATP-binding protein